MLFCSNVSIKHSNFCDNGNFKLPNNCIIVITIISSNIQVCVVKREKTGCCCCHVERIFNTYHLSERGFLHSNNKIVTCTIGVRRFYILNIVLSSVWLGDFVVSALWRSTFKFGILFYFILIICIVSNWVEKKLYYK